ncbi:TIGR04211 family SH3 domain-containing protein [Desulfobulbus alkaliphilus]|uniref:TIGR04211 family SH3 domain-containing protein n=1 Tax=Desulfobulbus alkaliphilus TaxID=869814 RepID=UPI0019663E44|nr:TIGR04211 family SH3 domain-containing protein [Desulfobulbus alkaliphilus]MBM9537944.1 TIGR04211 family SH3 domain-containing protein [Desulfobulbus alkaliphilus]
MNFPAHPSFNHNTPWVTFLLVLCSFFAAPLLLAETRYIKPSLEVTVYQEQNVAADTLASIWMGEAVQVVLVEEEWTHIRLEDGTEGWVHSRFLDPAPLLPDDLPGAAEATDIPVDLQVLFKSLITENEQLRKEIAATRGAEQTAHSGTGLAATNDPATLLNTTILLDEALGQLEEKRVENAVLQIENSILKKNQSIKWFLAGSGTLLLGWLIGRMTNSGVRRKKSSLL